METSADLKVALAATAKVCPKCKGSVCKHGYWHDKPCNTCPHCTNGVQFSDERARELLAIRDAAIALSTWLEETGKEPDIAEFNRRSVALREAICAARAKEGATNGD